MGPHATYPVKAIMGMVSANAKAYDTENPDPDTSCKASHPLQSRSAFDVI